MPNGVVKSSSTMYETTTGVYRNTDTLQVVRSIHSVAGHVEQSYPYQSTGSRFVDSPHNSLRCLQPSNTHSGGKKLGEGSVRHYVALIVWVLPV